MVWWLLDIAGCSVCKLNIAWNGLPKRSEHLFDFLFYGVAYKRPVIPTIMVSLKSGRWKEKSRLYVVCRCDVFEDGLVLCHGRRYDQC